MPKKREPLPVRRILKPKKPVFVPERIPPVPAKQWLASGTMTRRTKAITDFASRFQGAPMKIARDACKEIAAFRRLPLGIKQLRRYYARRTADEIIRSRLIVTGNQSTKEKGFEVEGCIDYCNALCAILRAKGIPAMFVREMNHSVVHFFTGKTWMRADPTYGTAGIIGEAKSAWIKKQKKKKKGKRHYAEGFDSHDIGIFSLNDFAKYALSY
ncbi:MAG: transglutaminase domain-containing protein [Candidatus Diapherotrites archaeon]|nr:transglutaminase domain-containing protein [Candidatus Diapherotrites archaeon]